MGRKRRRARPQPATRSAAEPAAGRRTRLASARLALGFLALAGLAAAFFILSRTARPNLLLVTIDTLRADRVGAYGAAGAETPVLDALARRGARFENALSPAPLTGPSHATILTGHHPPVHGVRDNVAFVLGERHPTLALLLRQRGYRTAAFVGAYPVAAAYGFGQGFDHYNEDFRQTSPGSHGAERPGNEVADRAGEWLAAPGERPFFAWVHFYDPHFPYAPPEPYAERFADRPYEGEVAFTDAQLGRLLEALRAAGHAEDTVVAVVADHGEALGEHAEATHGILIYQSTLRVPFVLAGPNVPSGVVVPARVGLVDLLPTLLGLAGLEPPGGLPGRDLRPALTAQPLPPARLYAESLFGRLNCRWSTLRAGLDGDWKLVLGAAPELFDLASDPGELRDLAAEQPERVKRMRAELQEALREMAPDGDAARARALSAEQEERLRSLGYVGGSGGGGPLDQPGLPDPRRLVHTYERIQHAMGVRGPGTEQAVREMAGVVQADPGNPFAHFALGHVAYRDGRFGTAAQAFARGLELDPERPGMRQPYGRLLREMGRLEDSERQLRIAVEQTTADDDRTRVALAETLLALRKTDEAERLLDSALSRASSDPTALAAKGRLLEAQGRAAEAVTYLGRAGAADQDSAIELAELYLRLGQAAPARETAGRVLAGAPGHPWALAITGRALILERRREEGLAVLRLALAQRPRRPEAWLSLARAFEAAGQAGDAERCRRSAEAARKA